ncbi:hypothetical protein [Nocardioides pelophilus]|uniref:hypothetical protein n=1 Tax=Nocardioides pelophilus TaxID=2172019 RepID=UPI001603DBF3|nr:hypothetical protein [Nocardioides pelophilus]
MKAFVRRSLATVLAVAGTGVGISGCADDSCACSYPGDADSRRASFPVVAGGRADGGHFAALNGSLRLSGGCLVVRTGTRVVVPVFLSGDEPRWDADDRRLRLAGEDYGLGRVVEFGGGEADVATLDEAAVPAACRDRRTYFVVTSGG